MPRVAVIFTGGTISMQADDAAGGNIPTLDGAAILALTPGLREIAEVVAVDRGLTPASHFTFPGLIELAGAIRTALADASTDGAVVVQGTDTIEETAFLFDLLLGGEKPVVVTGAMRVGIERHLRHPGAPLFFFGKRAIAHRLGSDQNMYHKGRYDTREIHFH